jgi:ornithine cyclodeaminase/alanine dehydrogenase
MTAPNSAVSFVSASAVSELLDWKWVIEGLSRAYSVAHEPTVSPPRSVARHGRIWLRSLTAVPPGARFMGGKLFGMGPRPAINYLIPLFEQETGELRALVDGAFVTSFRTASTSAAALDALLPKDKLVVGVIGSGQEAEAHARAILAIRQMRELRIFSPTSANRARFAKTFEAETGVKCVPTDTAQDAVRPAHLVVAAARSRDESPILYGDWLENCCAVVSIGSTVPEQREIDISVTERCDLIVCDVLDEVVQETGDMIAAKQAGISFEHKCISLNQLLCGTVDDKVKNARLPMFKSVGAGIQDIVCAELAYELASKAHRLVTLPIEFYRKTI